MEKEFLTVRSVLDLILDGGKDDLLTDYQTILRSRGDPNLLERERCELEQALKKVLRPQAEDAFRILFSATSYLSNLIAGPVPVLVSREEMHDMAASGHSGDGAAFAIARSLERLVRSRVTEQVAQRDDKLVERIQKVVGSSSPSPLPMNGRYLNTEQIGERLSLAPKTVRRLCNEGEIDADKTSGGEWRTTIDRLEKSPYLNNGRKGGRKHAKVE
jgi:hypothetical protein